MFGIKVRYEPEKMFQIYRDDAYMRIKKEEKWQKP